MVERNKYALANYWRIQINYSDWWLFGNPNAALGSQIAQIDVCVNFLGQSCCLGPDPKICEGKCPKANILLELRIRYERGVQKESRDLA
jgi:hypothetical protein